MTIALATRRVKTTKRQKKAKLPSLAGSELRVKNALSVLARKLKGEIPSIKQVQEEMESDGEGAALSANRISELILSLKTTGHIRQILEVRQ